MGSCGGNLAISNAIEGDKGKKEIGEQGEGNRKGSIGDDVEDTSFDGYVLNYDSVEFT